jgi:hypothetical protein
MLVIDVGVKFRTVRVKCSSIFDQDCRAQPSARSFAISVFTASQQKNFNHKIALFFYNTGTSFSRIEDPFLLSAIQLACPQAKLPTRKQLANDSPGDLLQEYYEEVKSKVDSLLSKYNQFMSITSDAWSNIDNESVFNYMAVSPSKSLFLESVNTEEQGHDAEWLSQDTSRVIDGIGENVVGAITDNTAANVEHSGAEIFSMFFLWLYFTWSPLHLLVRCIWCQETNLWWSSCVPIRRVAAVF